MPKVEASGYEGLEATERKTEVTEEQVDAGVEQLREQNARFDPVEGRGARDHDFVMGDLTETGPDGGEPRKHEGVTIEVGSEAYHEKLHEALQGAEAGSGRLLRRGVPRGSPGSRAFGQDLRGELPRPRSQGEGPPRGGRRAREGPG